MQDIYFHTKFFAFINEKKYFICHMEYELAIIVFFFGIMLTFAFIYIDLARIYTVCGQFSDRTRFNHMNLS